MNFYNNSYFGFPNQRNNFSNGAFYSLFIGLDDKCKGTQIISTQKALKFTEEVCKKYFVNGFTILIGTGANRGSATGIENSIYIMAINASEKAVFEVAQILRREFNITEVLIERSRTQYLYFNN